jgi:hypothetical protein
MRSRDSDTSPEARAVLVGLAREMSPARKFEIATSMSRSLRDLAAVGVRSRNPTASPEELRRRLAAVLLPAEIAEAAYGRVSPVEGP